MFTFSSEATLKCDMSVGKAFLYLLWKFSVINKRNSRAGSLNRNATADTTADATANAENHQRITKGSMATIF